MLIVGNDKFSLCCAASHVGAMQLNVVLSLHPESTANGAESDS